MEPILASEIYAFYMRNKTYFVTQNDLAGLFLIDELSILFTHSNLEFNFY